MSTNYDNNGQYSRHSILRYEKIFGAGFVSSGGMNLTRSFCDRLSFGDKDRVLDIGSGLGGAAFYMAETYGASVLGLDLSEEMIDIANERVAQQNIAHVEFRLADALAMDFEESSFDLIWSRDALLHIPQKAELFALLAKWLAPGGQIMISDYARKAGEVSPEFQAYVEKSGYDLLDVESYGALLSNAGFQNVKNEDWSEQFIEVLRAEQNNLRDNREHFLQDFTGEDLDYLVERWERKIQYCLDGDMHTGLWYGTL